MADDDLLRAAQFDLEFSDYWTNLFDEEDKKLAPYLRRLMIKLWEYRRKNQIMHKTTACRFIPVEHSVSSKKYIDLAQSKGWITFSDDPKDKRKQVVTASDQLLELVEEHLLASTEKIKNIAAELKTDADAASTNHGVAR